MERPLDAGAIVIAERADVLHHEGDVDIGDLAIEERHLRVGEAGLRPTAKVHHDLDQRFAIRKRVDGGHDLGRQGREQGVEVVDRFALSIIGSHADLQLTDHELADARRHEGRFGDADKGFLHQERDRGDGRETGLLQPPIQR